MFTYIDLFAGIGGFHIAMDDLGGKCVFASEWDQNCRITYETNFRKTNQELFENGNQTYFAGDITKVDPNSIPDHDVLCAGFPCQPFSQAGLKKGFEDTRGTLFFNIANIIKIKKPRVVFLENVRGLLKHDSGRTFEIIKNTMTELGYSFHYKIVKASDFNSPQLRPRLYMICFRNDIDDSNFSFPEPIPLEKDMSWVFDGASVNKKIGFTLRVGGKSSAITDRRNWDGYIVDGKERRITPKEGKRMQGFPENFEFPVSKTAAMKQLGNSVAIPAVKAVGKEMIKVLNGRK
ncbi:DNA cytosine methyltransferase [Mycoplasmopsis agassizii]|uniref:DNA cytosine methyltransferase n=1 Tax=Mycoplasmopsis agassizii TaxID=33922 RepID=UPI0035281DD2